MCFFTSCGTAQEVKTRAHSKSEATRKSKRGLTAGTLKNRPNTEVKTRARFEFGAGRRKSKRGHNF